MFKHGKNPASKIKFISTLSIAALAALFSNGVATAQAALSTPSYNFGNVVVGQATAPRLITLTNNGSATITISGITASGAGFAVDPSSTCSTVGGNPGNSLAHNASCKIALTWTPGGLGAGSGSLTVTTTAPNVLPAVVLSGNGVSPTSLTASLAFGNVVENTTSAAKTLILTNNQSIPLSIGSISVNAPFALFTGANACGASLAAHSSCYIYVTFSPTALGPAPATVLSVPNNGPTNPLTSNLSGTGILSTSLPPSYNFGNVIEGTTSAPYALSLWNHQSVPLSITSITTSAPFAVTTGAGACGASLAANSSCKIYLTFSPTSLGFVTPGTVTVIDNATPSSVGSTLYGTGALPTTLTSAVSFGNVVQNTTSAAKTLLLSNNQTVPLSIGSVSVAAPYTLSTGTNACGAGLAAHSSCYIYVTFSPTAVGPAPATMLSVPNNGPTTPLTSNLTGTGVLPTSLPPSYNFGNVIEGTTSAPYPLTLWNYQSVPLSIASITTSAPFAVTTGAGACGASLAANSSCKIYLTFSPTSLGPVPPGTVTVTDNATPSSVTSTLYGTGVVATTLTSALPFGNIVQNTTSAPKTLILSNYQSVPLSIGSISVNPPFALSTGTNACGTSLAAHSTCNIYVTFSPTALGHAPATVLSVPNNGPTTPLTSNLTGTGIVAVGVAPSPLTFLAQLVGTTSTAKVVTITNNQTAATLHFSGATITGLDSSDFSWANSPSPNTCSAILPGSTCQLLVTFSPQVSGTRTAQLNINDDGPSTPQSITLTGPGNAPASVTPMSITNFSTPAGSTSAGSTITIKNNNTSTALTIYSFQFTGHDFVQAATSCGTPSAPPNLPPYTLNPGASCTVTIQFAPKIGGTRTGQLQVNDSDVLTSPQIVNLSGTGINPLVAVSNPSVNPPALIFSAVPAGQVSVAPKTVTLTNNETQSETFSIALNGDFTLAGNSCSNGTIAAQSSCIISVNFAPRAAAPNGPDHGSLVISDSAPGGSPLTISLSGSVGIPQPAVAVVTPGAGPAGNTALTVVITGNGYTHFNANSVISFTDTDSPAIPSDISPTIPTPSATTANQITASLNIGANTSLNPVTYGARNITVTTPLAGGGTETAFLNSAFILYDPNNTHTITVVNPASATQGQTLNVGLTATGTNFINGTTIANFGEGITVNSLQVTDATDAVANITVSNYANAGVPTVNPSYRTVVLSTGGEYASANPTAFQVTPNTAALTAVSSSPSSNVAVVEPQSFSGEIYITGTGTHFLQNATVASIGGGVIVGDITVTSPTTATVNVAVPANASPGPQNVTVSTGGEIETLVNSFTIVGATPALLSVTPASGVQGQTGISLVITGNAYTTFNQGSVQLNMTGLITPTNVVANSASQVTATLAISQFAPTTTITGTLIYTNLSNQTTNFPFSFTITPSNASIVSVTPPCVPQGAQVTLALVGSNTIWSTTSNPVTAAGFYPLPVVEPYINELQVQSNTNATLNVTVPSTTPPGNYEFYMATGGQIVNSSLCVYAATPSVSITPANGLVPTAGVSNIPVTFNGQFTHWAEGNADPNQNTQVPVIAGEGVTVSNFVVNPGGLSATANINIAAGAATGARLVTVTTGSQILTTYFNVTSTPVEIVSVTPPHAPQNATLNIQIVGLNTHWCDNVITTCVAPYTPSVVQFGPEITVVPGSVSVTDNTHLSVQISTNFSFLGNTTSSTPGYQTVYVVTGNEAVTGSEQVLGSFAVDPPAVPTLVSVVPDTAPQGSETQVTITGSLTNWCSANPPNSACPNPTEGILGAGVTIANLTATSATTATATISVSPTAPVGGNSVTMITGSEVVGGTGFSVTPSNASIKSVGPVCNPNATFNVAGMGVCGGTESGTPWVVSQLQTTTLSVVGVGTHWLQGDTTFSFGGGVFIDALHVTSPTTATVQITVLSSAPVGFVSLTANTDGESVTLQNAIDIEEGFPTLLAIAPQSGSQGATIQTFQVLGRFTHFCDNVTVPCAAGYTPSQLTFAGSPGITVSSINVVDNDNLTATITVSPLAYIDYTYPCSHVLTVTTSDNEQISTAPILDNFCVTQGPAQINSVSLPAIPAGNTGVISIVGSDTHFEQGVTTVSFSDSTLSVPNGDVSVADATHLTATIAASTSATPGTKTVTVQTYGEVASEQFAFSVLPDQPVLTEANPAQAEQGAQLYTDPAQTGINVILTGDYTHFSSQSTATFGPGIVVNSVTQQSPTQVTANITIDPLSYAGGRTVTVTTPGIPCSQQTVTYALQGCANGQSTGTGSEVVSAGVFQIIAGPAIISNVSPNTGNEGVEIVYNITGTDTHWQQNFTQFYIAGEGSDLTVNSVIINSPTSATVDMNISPTANPGARSIFMSTAGENVSDTGAFVVTGGVPAIAYISPSGADTGAGPVQVNIRGIYTNWSSGNTVLSFGPGITVASYQIDDNFNIEAVLGVASNATLGYHVFTVTTGNQVLTGNFYVTAAPGSPNAPPPPAPFIWSEVPSTALPGQTLNVYFTGLYTKWDPNPISGTQFSFGSGIQVNTCQVTSQTSALCNITITATTAQTNEVVFTTGSETESAYFNVVIAQPVLSVVDPGSAIQGANDITVNILGQFTAFDSTTTFSFGPNVTVNGPPTILGPTVATQSISIPQLAPTGGYPVVASTPDAPTIAQVVGGAGFSITPSLAVIQTVNPNVAQQGVTGFVVNLTGQNTHWNGSTVFQFGDGITVTGSMVSSNTTAQVTISVPAYASEGATYVSATTGGEVASLNNGFVVSAGTPYLLSSGPGSEPQQGSATFTILAQQTGWSSANPPMVSYGAGVNITNVQVTSPQSLTVSGSIQATTPLGYRNLTVINGTQVLSLANALYITSGPAAVNSVTPSTGGQGVNIPALQIMGTNTNWAQGVTTLTFPGVLVNSFVVNSPTLITANVTVSAYAPAGQVSVTTTTGGEVAIGVNLFTITQTQPQLLAVVPSSGPQGWTTQNVHLTGDFTHFCDNMTTTCTAGYTPSTAYFGTGIVVNSVTAASNTSATANVTVEPTTSLGYRNVTVTTGTENVTYTNGFNVTLGPAAISNLTPSSAAQNTSTTIVVTGSQTHFCDNIITTCQNGSPVTSASFGGGIQVTGISVTDVHHASVNITIPNSVSLGFYNVTLTTGAEVATINGGFQVISGQPVLTVINPATGTQGSSEPVTITGLYTHFCDNVAVMCASGFTPSSITFGSGIAVGNIVAVSNTQLTARLTISPTATIQSYTPSVTTGSEVASITGGFSVLAGVPTLLTASPNMGQAGTSGINVVITGEFTTFQQAFSSVSFGSGVQTNFISNVTPTSLTANISIASNAAVGTRNITVTTNGQQQTLTNGFNVTAGTPVITQISPNFGNPGQNNLMVTLAGQYTNWTSTTTVTFGTAADGISVGGAAAGSPGPVVSATATSITVSLNIASGAPLGPATVSTSEGESVPGGFTVQAATIPAPSLLSISPGPNNGSVPNSGNLPINSNIIVVFSQPMNRTTINTSTFEMWLVSNPAGWVSVPATVTVDATGRIATFTPTSLLAVNSQYYLLLTNGIMDATGNTFPEYGYASYYTTDSANTTAPTVVAANPPALSTVGTNVTPQLYFSVPMDEATQTGMTVSTGGNPVAGTYSWNNYPYGSPYWGPGNLLTFTPTAPLTPNTVYTVAWNNSLTDTAGNQLTPGSFTFTTGAAADTSNNSSGSDFTSTYNNGGVLEGLLDAPTNFAPRMNYAKAINPIDINTSTLMLYNADSNKYIQGTVTVAANGLSAQFTPTYPLLPGTNYRFYQAGGYYDVDGNYLNGVNDYFTTASGTDTTAPYVVSMSPPNNATNIPLNTEMIVSFDTQIDPDSISGSVALTPMGGSPVTGTASLSSDQLTMFFVPNNPLTPGTVYNFTLSGFEDVAGNVGTTFTSSFRTANSIAPINVSTGLDSAGNLIAANNANDAHWIVTPTASEASGLLAATTTSSPACLQTGGVCTTQPLQTVGSGDTGFYGGWPGNGNGSDWITINPNDVQGNTFGVYSTTFNIPNPVPSNLCLTGLMGVDDNGVLGINGTAIMSNLSAIGSLSSINISISSFLVAGSNTLSLAWGSTDNYFEAFRLQGTIGTCNSSYAGGLTVVSETPAYGQSGVATNANITLVFNHSLDPATVNATTLPVMVGWNSNQELAGTYAVTTTTLPNDTVTYTPDAPFPANTQIFVGSCYGPYDLAGDQLAPGCFQSYIDYFYTNGTPTAATTPFRVLAFTPSNGATNVGLHAPVAATFNRSLDLNTVNSTDYDLFANGGQQPWCSGGNYTHSQDDTTIIFNCGIMPASSNMTAILGSGLTDWLGNTLAPYTSTFQTSIYDSNTNGNIVSSAPGNGAGNVANNLPIVLYGDLPFNASTATPGFEAAQNNVALPGTVQVIDNGYTLVFTPSAPYQAGALIQWWTTNALADTTYNTPFNGASGYFYVAPDTSTLTPTVQSMSPPNGNNPTPLNAFFDILFNTPLNASTVTPSNIFMYDSGNGQNVPVTYFEPQPNVVRMVPASPLPPNTWIYLNVGTGLQSTTSVPAASCSNCKAIYTGTTADSTTPTIVSAVPYNGATNVGINVDPGVVISKPIDPVSVNSTTFAVTVGGNPTAGSFFFNGSNTRVQFSPNTSLPANTTITITLNGVLDMVGNSIHYTSSFTTGNGPDYNRPTVVTTSVSNSATVPVNAAVSVQFSESMDVTTLSTDNNSSCGDLYLYDSLLGTCIPGTLSWSADQSIAYLVPSASLAAGRTYYLYINSGTDLAGNQINYFETTFQVATSAAGATSVIAFNPANGAAGVGTNAYVEVQFSAPIDPTTVKGVTLKQGASFVSITPVLSAGNTVLQLAPSNSLLPNSAYTINVAGVKDTMGAAVAATTSSFTTGATFDISPLTVVEVSPSNYATVGTNISPRFKFNKPLNPTTVNTNTFRLYTSNPTIELPITVTLSADLKTVTLTPAYPLQPGTEYQFSGGWAGGPQDENGNYLNLPWYYFYTNGGADTTSPTVTVSPANNSTGVPLNAQVIAFVSAQVDPTTVNQNAITVTQSGNPVAGTVSVVNPTQISFTPASPLIAGDVYQVSIANFTDVNGNAVTPSVTSFTAGTAATTPGLSLIQSDDNPAYNATGVSPNTTITLQFTQNLDPATLNGTLYVMNGWNSNQGLPGTWAVNPSQPNQAIFTPSEPLPYGAQIFVGNCGGPEDVLGEVFYNGNCFQQYLDVFTIATGAPGTQGTAPLAVTAVSPANGATNLATNTPVSVTFNNPVVYSSWNSGSSIYNILLYAGQGLQADGNNISISADGRTLTFNNGLLYNGTTYTFDLPAGGITDEYGSSLTSTYTTTFKTATTEYAQSNGYVTSTNPGNTSGVPTNNLLTLYLNRPVDPSTLPGNLVVTVNGVVQIGTVNALADGYEVQFAPTSPFPYSATVQWWFANAEDTNGVPINGTSGYFYTAAAPSTAPVVIARSPYEGDSTNVPTSAEFDIEFSLPLLASTVNSTNVTVYDGNTGWLPTSAYNVSLVSTNTVRITPNPGPWSLNHWIYACVGSGVQSTGGVAVNDTCEWTTWFYPDAAPDTTPGTLTIGPPNGAANVGTNAYIRVNFSKPADTTTVNNNIHITTGGNPVAGSWSYTSDNTGAYFSPVNPLTPNTVYQVAANTVQDYSGNAFPTTTSTFTTGPMPVFTAPTVTLDFAYGQTGISTTASFTCHYSVPMDPSSLNSSNLYVYSYVTNAAVPATITVSADMMSATITPTSPLYTQSQYYYQCYNAIDLTGNGQNNAYALFYTGGGSTTLGPQLVYANPPNGLTNVPLNTSEGIWNNTSLDLLFNEPIATESMANITLTPTNPPGAAIPIAAYAQDGNFIASIVLPYALRPNTTYAFNVAGVTDVNGNPASGTTTSSFTTGSGVDYVNPVTTSFLPANGATDYSVDGSPFITFSEPMNPTVVNPSNVYLRLHNNTNVQVPATVSISADYKTVTVTPTAPLQPSTIYDLLYYPQNFYMYDIAGNADYNYGVFSTFTTGAALPVNGACGTANGGNFATPPTINLCSAGTASALLNSSNTVSWSCAGVSTGTTASCSATITPAQACVSHSQLPYANLISWWKADDNATDSVGGNNGTLENGVTYALGEVNDAFSLNGSDQYVLIGSPVPTSLQIGAPGGPSSSTGITLQAWIYPTAIPTDYGSGALGMIVGSQDDGVFGGTTIFFDGRVNPDGYNGIPTGHIHFQIGDGSEWHSTDTETQLPLNQWTLVTATRVPGGPPIVYYNGVSQPLQTTNSWNGVISYPSSDWFAIGQEVNENRPFTGSIDDVQIYNTALTATQIQAIYAAGNAGICP